MFTKVVGLLVILPSILSSVLAIEYCYSDVVGACSPAGGELQNCNAKYGHFSGVMKDLQSYANAHISRNFQFLLMSTHFSNYEAQRPGLAHLYRKYADKSWEDSIELMKYIAKRGGVMDFTYKKQNSQNTDVENYEMSELHSLGKALDIWKNIAEEAHSIHGEAARRRDAYHDPEVASFIENEFVHEHAKVVRQVSGLTNDLKRMLAEANDVSLSLFLFDQSLKRNLD